MAQSPADLLEPGRPLTLANVADGAQGLIVADLARAVAARADAPATSLLVVCRDGTAHGGAGARARVLRTRGLAVLEFPSWDCLPYDRVSPHAGVVAQRMTALSRLARLEGPRAAARCCSPRSMPRSSACRRASSSRPNRSSVAPGNLLDMASITRWLELNGFSRASTVREPGDYAVRGGIIDLFAPGMAEPVRLDFFGDTLETIRSFDPETQRTTDQLRALDLVPVAEFQLTTETIKRFRLGYVEAFGAPTPDDLLYDAVSEGRRHPGMEHWLPLFHDRIETMFDYVPGSPIVLEPLDRGRGARAARPDQGLLRGPQAGARRTAAPGRPTGRCRRTGSISAEAEWRARLDAAALGAADAVRGAARATGAVIDVGTRQGRNFAAERAEPGRNVFEAVTEHVQALQAARKRVVIALWSEGSRERMGHVLADHGLHNLSPVRVLAGRRRSCRSRRSRLRCSGSKAGSRPPTPPSISEQDILGDRLVRPRRAARRPENFIAEVTSLAAGDLVVHVDHGIGRFVGLRAIEAAGAPHDCLEIHYAGGDKLFLPVENIELLSRYGSEETGVELDRLGGGAWQARKARMKNRIREIANELIKIAAERQLREAPKLAVEHGPYDEFCAGFPYEETDDQQAAIDVVLKELASGRPMDRLICGDVGFGKTEVALRAAFVDGDERQAGRGGGADHAAGAPAHQDLHRALPRLSGEDRPGLAAGFDGRAGAA